MLCQHFQVNTTSTALPHDTLSGQNLTNLTQVANLTDIVPSACSALTDKQLTDYGVCLDFKNDKVSGFHRLEYICSINRHLHVVLGLNSRRSPCRLSCRSIWSRESHEWSVCREHSLLGSDANCCVDATVHLHKRTTLCYGFGVCKFLTHIFDLLKFSEHILLLRQPAAFEMVSTK